MGGFQKTFPPNSIEHIRTETKKASPGIPVEACLFFRF